MDPRLMLATLTLAVFAGCERGDAIVDPEPPPKLDAPISLEITGPWASPDTSVRIRPSGEAVASQDRGPSEGQEIEYELSGHDLELLDDAVELSFDEGGRRFPFRCLDCFVYEIRSGDDRLVLDQTALDASLGEKRLVGLIERGLPGELAR